MLCRLPYSILIEGSAEGLSRDASNQLLSLRQILAKWQKSTRGGTSLVVLVPSLQLAFKGHSQSFIFGVVMV